MKPGMHEDTLSQLCAALAASVGLSAGDGPAYGFSVGLMFMAAAATRDPSLAKAVVNIGIDPRSHETATADAERNVRTLVEAFDVIMNVHSITDEGDVLAKISPVMAMKMGTKTVN